MAVGWGVQYSRGGGRTVMKNMTGEYIEEINQLKAKKCRWLMPITGQAKHF
ncbi:MAG: hypothetical protein Q8K51_03065 [Nitrospirota bacterium]|nr:hypothetical protein [Nitrospirota bacterium]